MKRLGALALLLASGMAFLQPAVAQAQDRYDRGGYYYSGGDRNGYRGGDYGRRDWREQERRENEWRRRQAREWRQNQRWDRRAYRDDYNRYYAPNRSFSFGFYSSPY